MPSFLKLAVSLCNQSWGQPSELASRPLLTEIQQRKIEEDLLTDPYAREAETDPFGHIHDDDYNPHLDPAENGFMLFVLGHNELQERGEHRRRRRVEHQTVLDNANP